MEKRVTGERNSRNIAKYINTLGRFCGKRDVDELTQKSLYQKYGFHQADLMVYAGLPFAGTETYFGRSKRRGRAMSGYSHLYGRF